MAILDLSAAGHQPMHDPTTGNWIVFNGEIYNFLELRSKLEDIGYSFSSQTDTEVILKAYAAYGIDFLQFLRGIFSFAIWDAKKECMLLVRDHLGVKPLYYYQTPGRFLFASEVRALLRSGQVANHLCLDGLNTYLALGSVQDPWSMVEGVYALPAGHYGLWKGGEFTIEPYWTLPGKSDGNLAQCSREEIVERLRALLEETVRLQMISDVPLGAFLSGGIDSSSLVSLMSRITSTQPRTVSIVFDEPEFCEANFLRLVANKFGTIHTEVRISADDILAGLPEAIDAMDQPSFDGVNTFFVSKYVRRKGLTVALSGLGGDELFAGYHNSFVTVLRLERLKSLSPGLIGRTVGTLTRYALQDRDGGRKLERWFGTRDLDGDAYLLIRELFSPEMRGRLVPSLGNASLRNILMSPFISPQTDLVSKITMLELMHYTRNVLLRDTDMMSMAHALEVRVPFLDHKIVEFMLSVPCKFKSNQKKPKSLLVDAVGDLPREIAHRKKQGFVFPFSRWMPGELKTSIEESFFDLNSSMHLLNEAMIKETWSRFLNGKGVWVRPWALHVLLRWCRMHLSA